MSDVEKAISLALEAHKNQKDKAGKPYILHPLRLAFKFQNEEQMIVATLHDVIEDSDLSIRDLERSGFSLEVINAIDCLTKRPGESYESFILRVSGNELARLIKIEDIKDNLDLTRLSKLSDEDLERVRKYHNALMQLAPSAQE